MKLNPTPTPGKKRKKARLLGLIVSAAGLVAGIALIAVAVIKLQPPAPPIPASSVAPVPVPAAPSAPEYDAAYLKDKLFITTERAAYQSGQMVLKIPCMGVDKAVQNGTTDEIMAIGPGLYDYAQLPSQNDCNVSIVAHRDIAGCEFYFAHKLGAGDLFYLVYNDTIFVYAYKTTFIVEPDDWSPIYLQGYSCLTLTTCNPIGSTRERLVVRAELVDTVPFDDNYSYAPWAGGITKPYTWDPKARSWNHASEARSSSSAASRSESSDVSSTSGSEASGASLLPGSSSKPK